MKVALLFIYMLHVNIYNLASKAFPTREQYEFKIISTMYF